MKKQNHPAPSKATSKTTDGAASDIKKGYGVRGGRELFLLYSILAWELYLKHQPAFVALSSKFTVKLADDELAALKKLKKMAQQNKVSDIRIDLWEDHAVMGKLFRSGLWYIGEAFSGETVRTKKLQEAGLLKYDDKRMSREKAVSLIKVFRPFLTKNKKELEAYDNMPASFIKEFDDAAEPLPGQPTEN
ncbi:MAG: hypothetical protein IPM82_30240 [Saprospiraceae bacterium]|nr:hypothetical protein [Saprospiraceae bacterium]